MLKWFLTRLAPRKRAPKVDSPDSVSTDFYELQSPRHDTRIDDQASVIKSNPLDSANFLSRATLSWIQPLLLDGYKTPLSEDKVWELPKMDQCQRLQGRFDASWANQNQAVQNQTKKTTPSVHMALWNATKDKVAVAICLYIVTVALMLVQPFLIKAIVEYLDGGKTTNSFGISSGYGLALSLGCVAFGVATSLNMVQYLTSRAGCNARMIVINAVFQKILRLNATARANMNRGEVVTLAGVDSERIMDAYSIGLWCIVSPMFLTIVCFLIGTELGFQVALAAAMTCLTILYSVFVISKRIGQYRRRIATISANRVKLTNEALVGIRVIKFYAWEDAMNDLIQEIRENEVQLMRRYNYLRLANAVVMFLAPTVLNAVCVMIYILLGNTLTVPTTFCILALSNACKIAFTLFANASVAVSEALIATSRFSDFLSSGEVEQICSRAMQEKAIISLQEAEFQWIKDTAKSPTLSKITLTLRPGTLTIVVGSIGSGKSSLLNAILGEMHHVCGTRVVHGDIAYASQVPWIQNQSVRKNILFGEPYDAPHYRRVIEACQLMPDFDMLEQGEETEIGERGINLSGGQKARVVLARALYRARHCDFVLLDDPLSALDVHVANAVFFQGIRDLASHSTRILVLNSHYHLLPYADRIVVMKNGQIVGKGTLDDLQGDFSFLVASPRAQSVDCSDEKTKDTVNGNHDNSLRSIEGKKEERKEGRKEHKKLIVEEDRQVGSVQKQVYVKYLAASGWNGYFLVVTLVFVFVVAQFALFSSDWFLSQWSKKALKLSQKKALVIYASIVIFSLLLTFFRCAYFMEICMRCSGRLHLNYIRKVLGAPVPTFFDVTPVGRILNRFSRDFDQVDNSVPYHGLWLLLFLFQMGSGFLVCAATNPFVLVLYIPVAYAFKFAVGLFQSSSRELKRMDSISRTSFLNLVSETMSGIETIRSFHMVKRFSLHCQDLINYNGKFVFLFQSTTRWFALRTDWIASAIITCVAILAIATRTSLGPTMAGLGLTYGAQLTSSFQRAIVLATVIENVMTCFERIAHYDTLPKEGDERQAFQHTTLSPAWPQTGRLVFHNVSMRYRDDLPFVLKHVSFAVSCGEKVGICGRTGSGKSSLMSVLFRVVEIPTNGRVMLDGVDIATLAVHQLRSKLTIIPQDPMLFSGSLRLNLDPFSEKSDAELYDALRKVHLSNLVTSWGKGLDYEVAEKGDNLSVGQRQLLCIARALIRGSKVIVMDEATANVDKESDKLIQKTMKESFGKGQHTVLCIAHRIGTIMDSDKILVLDAGEVVEYDTPSALLKVEGGMFRALVQSGKKALP